MRNTLEILTTANGNVKTTIVTSDSVIVTELHDIELADRTVILRLQKNKYYMDFKGDWVVTMPQEHKVFAHQNFKAVLDLVLHYIYIRDNPEFPDYYD